MLRRRTASLLTRTSLLVFQNNGKHGCRAMSNLPEMPPCDFQPKKYKGIAYEDAVRVRKQNLHPVYFTYYKKPALITQGHMQWLFDDTGKRYLDMFAGIVTVGVGHCHPKVNAALKEQVDTLWHTTNIYLHPKIHEYAEKLVSKLPGNLKVCFFTNSGSEANDLAMVMARLYSKSFDIISLRNAYHGMSPYTAGLTASSNWKYNIANGFGIHHTMNPDVYRGLWGGSHCKDSPVQTTRKCNCEANSCMACDNYIKQLEDLLNYSVPKKNVAGFFIEPIQGVGGAVQYPKQYLQKAFALIRERGGVCIADEVQTGFGRTGEHYWGFQMYDVIPDMVTMAKGMGNGFPMAAVVTTPEIANAFTKSLHLNTFGGNPMACAVGIAVMDAIKEDKCQENCLNTGTFLLNELAKLRDKFEVVGDVRGKGLMIGVEFVTDKETRTPLPAEEFADIWEDCKDMGVLIGKGGHFLNVLRIKPPMCITKEDVKFCVSVLEQALLNHQAKTRR